MKKNAPDERVGAICLEDGRPSIVEYYDMTQELMDPHLIMDRNHPALPLGDVDILYFSSIYTLPL